MSAMLLQTNRQRQLIDKLRSLGTDKYIALPQIAVMGDTSAGKSSVLTNLSGIEFPSSHGLTTRCATQLILSSSDGFYCEVSIQRYSSETKESTNIQVSSIKDITQVISDLTKELVKDLGPNGISQDSIVIQLADKNLPNLTLIDLPGFVTAVGDDEDAKIITDIKELVKKYLDQERTVILAVAPANVEMHNIQILQLAQEADPEGNRTMSVITKPDLVDKGGEQAVIDLLTNKKKFLRLGYHAVKCRGQKSHNDGNDVDAGLIEEEKFFENDKPWSTVDKSLVGTENLRQRLSDLLEHRIGESLPEVRKEIQIQLKGVSENLEKMGPELDSPTIRRQHFYNIVEKMKRLLQCSLSGKYDDAFFSARENRLCVELGNHSNEFDQALRERRLEDADIKINDKVIVRQKRDFDFKAENIKGELKAVYQHEFDAKAEHSVGSIGSYSSYWSVAPELSVKIQYHYHKRKKYKDFLSIELFVSKMIDKIMTLNEEYQSDQLPLFLNYEVFRCLIREELNGWSKIVGTYRFNVLKCLKEFWTKVTKHVSSDFQLLKRYFDTKGQEELETLEKNITIDLDKYLEFESNWPHCKNHYLFDIVMKMKNDPLIKSLDGLADSEGNASIKAVKAQLALFGIGKTSNKEQEAKDIYTVFYAYVKATKKRFIDEVIGKVKLNTINRFARLVDDYVNVTESQLDDILCENRSTQVRRREMRGRKRVLSEAFDHIKYF